MLENNLYVQTDLTTAVMRSSELQQTDSDNWFYKRWRSNAGSPALTDLPGYEKLDSGVDQGLELRRKHFRDLMEHMNMPHPASQPFPDQKDLIEHDKIYEVFKIMPKCGLLHVHNTAALSAEGLIELLKQDWDNTAYIVTNFKAKYVVGSLFFVLPADLPQQYYTPVKDFLADPVNEKWLLNLLTFRSTPRMQGVPYIWDEFNNIFMRTKELFVAPDFFKAYHESAFREMIDDNIDYVELRCGFQDFISEPLANQRYAQWEVLGNSRYFIELIQDAMLTAQQYHAAKPMPDITATSIYRNSSAEKQQELVQLMNDAWERRPQFEVRVILNARRDINPYDPVGRDNLLRKLDSAILWKSMPQYANFIIGFDLVNEEDRGNATYAFFHKIIYARVFSTWQAVNGVVSDVPYQIDPLDADPSHLIPEITQLRDGQHLRIELIDFFLHDGESLWAESDNTIDAAVACHHRIGHGFNMVKYPGVVDSISNPGLLPAPAYSTDGVYGPILEICPISNQLLRYFPDLRNHTAYELMKRGINCVISNDDPQLFCNTGLSYDFWETYVALQVPFAAIKGLVFNAFASRFIADQYNGYNGCAGISQADYMQLIDDFNNIYWIPFLCFADTLL